MARLVFIELRNIEIRYSGNADIFPDVYSGSRAVTETSRNIKSSRAVVTRRLHDSIKY